MDPPMVPKDVVAAGGWDDPVEDNVADLEETLHDLEDNLSINSGPERVELVADETSADPEAQKLLQQLHDREKEKDDTLAKQLLDRLLTIENPKITENMLHFLLEEGNCEILISFITRVGDEPTSWQRPQARNDEELEALKKSYRAVMLLNCSGEPLEEVLNAHIGGVVDAFFAIFNPNSAGSFMHFRKAMEHLIQTSSQQLLKTIMEKGTKYMEPMLTYLYEPSVFDSFIALYKAGSSSDHRNRFCALLARCNFIEKLQNALERASESGDSELKQCVLEAVQRVNGEFLYQENVEQYRAGWIETPLALLFDVDLENVTLIRYLITEMKSASTETEERYLTNIVECLGSYINLALEFLEADRMDHPKAKSFFKRVYDQTEPAVQAVCVKFLEMTPKTEENIAQAMPGYTVKPVRMLRIAIMKFLLLRVHAVNTGDLALEPLLTQISTSPCDGFLRSVVNVLIDRRHNSMYQVWFFRLFRVILQAGHEGCLNKLLTRGKLVSRLIQVYKQEGNRGDLGGLTLVILNMLRLNTLAKEGSPYVRDILRSHNEFNTFMPTLLEDTKKVFLQQPLRLGQARDSLPPPFIAPDELNKSKDEEPNSLQQQLALLNMGGPPRATCPVDGLDDVELGSFLAKQLGFEDAHPVDDGGDGSAGVGTGGDAGKENGADGAEGSSGSSKKKKKNKKKKKKKKSGSGGAGVNAVDGVHDDDDDEDGEGATDVDEVD
eukprot:Clim_evm4s216 gene=Clim_evmTU4s216